MDFLEKMNELSSEADVKVEAVELPKEIMEGEVSDTTSDTANETLSFSDMVKNGDIKMSWVQVNTSKWCGCNNACYNGCQNVRV